MTQFHHVSVLLDECMEALNIRPDGIYCGNKDHGSSSISC